MSLHFFSFGPVTPVNFLRKSWLLPTSFDPYHFQNETPSLCLCLSFGKGSGASSGSADGPVAFTTGPQLTTDVDDERRAERPHRQHCQKPAQRQRCAAKSQYSGESACVSATNVWHLFICFSYCYLMTFLRDLWKRADDKTKWLLIICPNHHQPWPPISKNECPFCTWSHIIH